MTAFYYFFVERRVDGVTVTGDEELLERLLDATRGTLGVPLALPA